MTVDSLGLPHFSFPCPVQLLNCNDEIFVDIRRTRLVASAALRLRLSRDLSIPYPEEESCTHCES